MSRGNAAGQTNFKNGRYFEAREDFLATASLAVQANRKRFAASAFNNAGGAALARQDYRDALSDFLKARQAARDAREFEVLARTLNNLASLYLQMGDPAAAMQVAREGLALPSGLPDRGIQPKLRFQLASALAKLHRFTEARPIYRAAIDELDEDGDVDSTARALSSFGSAALDAGFIDEADAAMTEALRIVRIHRLSAANVLRTLARVKDREGDAQTASALFDAAITEPAGLTPRWVIYADRGDFRLVHDNLRGALDDFRAAASLVSLMRADIVPADQERIALESGLSRVAAGLVEAGNRLALKASDKSFLKDAFNAAEMDRLWSLRALVPSANDWRTRLPRSYWDLLARYQTLERALLAGSSVPSSAISGEAADLQLELQQIEAAAGAVRPTDQTRPESRAEASPLRRAQSLLNPGAVLLSFHLSERTSWIWAADRTHVDVYQLPSLSVIKADVNAYTEALKKGSPCAGGLGRNLYAQLFGQVPAFYKAHEQWLLELDGPLYELPFAALDTGEAPAGSANPVYLVQRAALEAIPSATLTSPQAAAANGEMLGIGDAIYNTADVRYRGASGTGRISAAGIALPRLTASAAELEACSRAWGAGRTRILSGPAADLAGVQSALRSNPSVIHFATHVIAGPGDHSSGLIALSLDSSGGLGLLGPTEIVAQPVTARLVVLNGCYSARGDTLPSAGLMGLTRAWIGAGAGAVLATRWNIPDDAGQNLMAAFYRRLRASPDRGPAYALQQAQLELLKKDPALNKSDLLGAYFLLGRI